MHPFIMQKMDILFLKLQMTNIPLLLVMFQLQTKLYIKQMKMHYPVVNSLVKVNCQHLMPLQVQLNGIVLKEVISELCLV